MRRVFRSRLLIACVAGGLTAIVSGGVAWALQSPVDGNGVIHACYNPTTGAVKLDTKGVCPATGTKTPISWNAQGQPGPAGPKGDPGASGGHAYYAKQVNAINLAADAPQQDIVSVSVPPGDYTVTANLSMAGFVNAQGVVAQITCHLVNGVGDSLEGGYPIFTQHDWNAPASNWQSATLSLIATSSDAAGSIRLQCDAAGTTTGGQVMTLQGWLIAQQVSAIN